MNLLIATAVFVIILFILNKDSFRAKESDDKITKVYDRAFRIYGYIILFILFWYILYGVLELALGL